MVAEYQPGRFRLQPKRESPNYTSPPRWTNPTRIVSDDQGNVVYAAAHNPYGGMQQTWVNTFNPELKFSGKEQDTESGLYYFGARYYDPTLYRFLSPDPVNPTDHAIYTPQRWNLYGYCLGNPISYYDEEGCSIQPVNILIQRNYYTSSDMYISGKIYINGKFYGETRESAIFTVPEGTYQGKLIVGNFSDGSYRAAIALYKDGKRVSVYLGYYASIHAAAPDDELVGCIGVPKEVMDKIVDYLVKQVQDYLATLAGKAASMALYASGIDQYLYAFYALDLLSLVMSDEIRQRINDSVSDLQIIVIIRNAN